MGIVLSHCDLFVTHPLLSPTSLHTWSGPVQHLLHSSICTQQALSQVDLQAADLLDSLCAEACFSFIYIYIYISVTIYFQYSMFLTTAPPLRRGSTPLPVKHQLRREEAVSDDCDWIPGLEEPGTLPISDTAVPRNESFTQSAAQSSYHSHGGALRIVLLGQNGVGKSSLALSLAGQSDRSLSIDSETQASGNGLNVWLHVLMPFHTWAKNKSKYQMSYMW